MRNQIVNKLLCITLIICVIMSLSAPAFASGEQLRYVAVNHVSTYMSISNFGLATCEASVTLRNASYYSNNTMTLDYYSNGNWHVWKTWTSNYDLSKHVQLVHGYYYRVSCTADVYTTSGTYVESASCSSTEQYY